MHTQTAEFTDIEYYRGQENTVTKNEIMWICGVDYNQLITCCKQDGLGEVSDLVSTLFLLKKDLPLSSSEQVNKYQQSKR